MERTVIDRQPRMIRPGAGVESSARHAAERGFQVIVVDDACAPWEEGCHAPGLRARSRDGSEPAAPGGRARRTYWYATMLVAQSGSTTSAGRGMSKRMRLSANCGSATCSMQRRQ